MEKAIEAFQLAEKKFGDRMVERGVLFDPSLGVEAGLLAALPQIPLVQLAIAIADHTARSDVECYARIVSRPASPGTRYDLSQAEDVPGDEAVAQRAAEYIRLRGDALPYKLVCVDETVFFEDRT